MNKLYLRVDMNSSIATGHMMRCLSIADAAKDQEIESVFITSDSESAELLSKRGYRNLVLGTEWSDLESETDILIRVIRENNIEILLIDSYYVTEKYLKAITNETFTVYIDDVNSFIYPVNVVICYANYFEKFDYLNRYACVRPNTSFLLGCDYVPLRKEFAGLPSKMIKQEIEEVLVVSGGSDPYNTIEAFVDSLLEYEISRIVAICGRYNNRIDYLKNKYRADSVAIYPAVDNLIEYMRSADLAISAGGSTLYELCACGTPTISFSMADNQFDNVKTFHNRGIIPYLGDIRYIDVRNNIDELLRTVSQYEFRREKSINMQSSIDAEGAKNIVNKLMAYYTG